MSSTTHDLVFVPTTPKVETSGLREVLAMAADAFGVAGPVATHADRVEAALFKVLALSALVVTTYGVYVAV